MNPSNLAGHGSVSLSRLRSLSASRLVRQNLVLFIGGLTGGVGGFVYHALAARALGPRGYGEVASLVALYSIGTSVNLVLTLVLARYTAALQTDGRAGAIRHLLLRSTGLLSLPAGLLLICSVLLATQVQGFEHLDAPGPVIWLGAAVAAVWFLSVPRGILQGTQRFPALSLNLGGEIVVRTSVLTLLLKLGLGVSGSMIAVLTGCLAAYAVGLYAQRRLLRQPSETVHMRSMLGFTLTATAGTLGILFLYNFDVILAKHFLSAQQAGIYGGLNKIATIIYFLTLSVSQVLFPRVVEAVARRGHPGRLLLLSAGITGTMGVVTIAAFALVPRLIVHVLFGSAFDAAIPYVLPVGVIGLGLSLDNLLVQFFMAVHDRLFIPSLALACVLLAASISLHHGGVGDVVADVAAVVYGLLLLLVLRTVRLMPRLRPEMVAEPQAVPEPA
ncbi:MAG TPA: lipopolysaccharide biosynthesis protein [Candidatus Nitrosotalea sp.]|nr:lipopolysaccharide biosynthesis protein [Candidatus Nitrosotalea sp.]